MLELTNTSSNFTNRRIAKAYLIAKTKLIRMGYDDEIDWQYDVSLEDLDEKTFLQEIAWVVLNSGMRESVVRNRFHLIKESFHYFCSAEQISKNATTCKNNALKHFNHQQKINAIISIANHISETGFACVFNNIKKQGTDYLCRFPYIGPITSLHLAKNIGIAIAKPDRHLERLASEFNFNSVQAMCNEISALTTDPVPVVDIVLWRFATLYRTTALTFALNLKNIQGAISN